MLEKIRAIKEHKYELIRPIVQKKLLGKTFKYRYPDLYIIKEEVDTFEG